MAKQVIFLALVTFIAASESALYLGCFRERTAGDTLLNSDFQDYNSTNTPLFCFENCESKGFPYAGLRWGRYCVCSEVRPSFESLAKSDSECDTKCAGDPNQICGGAYRIQVYSLADDKKSQDSSYAGCYRTGALRREARATPLTLASCKQSCETARYRYYGMGGGDKCFCGNDLRTDRISDQECRVPCEGDKTYLCGGSAYQLSVYRSAVPDDEIVDDQPSTTSSTTRRPSTTRSTTQRPSTTTQRPTTTTTTTTQRPITMVFITQRPTTNRPKKGSSSSSSSEEKKNKKSSSSSSSSEEKKNKKDKKNKHSSQNVAVKISIMSLGCYQDSRGSLLRDLSTDITNNSLDNCAILCQQQSFQYAGVQMQRCFCSDKNPDEKQSTNQNNCSFRCPGNNSQICGGRGQTSVFKIIY